MQLQNSTAVYGDPVIYSFKLVLYFQYYVTGLCSQECRGVIRAVIASTRTTPTVTNSLTISNALHLSPRHPAEVAVQFFAQL